MHAPLIDARPPRTSTLAWAITLVIVLGACGSPAASPTGGDGAGDGTISISRSAFSPASMTVASGDSFNFKNNDGFDHTIVVGENGAEVADPAFEAISLGGGDQTHDIRLSPGSYNLTCTIHSSMNMTVTVTE